MGPLEAVRDGKRLSELAPGGEEAGLDYLMAKLFGYTASEP